jgi:alpha-L-fucosidase
MDKETYLQWTAESRARRLRWFQDARFGMFVHWGLYSQIGRHEWVMNRECIPQAAYERLADTWKPIERPARAWARLAKQAGMKYMVMTTKHHEGFCLWDTQQTDYNAVKRGPGRDLVREYVEACREFDLKIGLYYSLMDWHHPDGALCAYDEAARQRFLAFTKGCVAELLTNYGKIDVLWYDVSRPLTSPEAWDSVAMNTLARELQPDILINNRSQLDEDFGTPEERIVAEARAWEACMTFNGSWGYMPSAIDWHSSRAVVQMLRTVSGQCGNLLLNIGPAPDGSIPPEATEHLTPVGEWTAANGEAMYGDMANTRGMGWMPTGGCTLKGNIAYYWVDRWPGAELTIGGLLTRAKSVTFLATGEPIRFEQEPLRLMLNGLPETNPDKTVGICVIKVEFEGPPVSTLEAVYAPQLLKAQGRAIEFVPAG